MKKSLLVFGAVLCLVLVVVLARTLTFSADRDPVKPLGMVDLDSEAAARRLAGAIRFETISYQAAARFDPGPFHSFHVYLAETFPEVHGTLRNETINGYSLLFTWEGRNPNLDPILLSAHQDVVPVARETLGDWTHPPFAGRIADGYIWGRGTLDMKSGLTGVLEAVTLLLREGFQPERTVYLAFGHDEEIGGSGGAARIAETLQQRGVVNFRILPGDNVQAVAERARQIIDDARVQIHVKPGAQDPSPVSDLSSDSFRLLARTIRGLSPDPHLIVAPYVTVAATDSRHYVPIADDIYRFIYNRGDAGDVKRIHGTDERISVRSYAQAIAFYYHLIRGSMSLPERPREAASCCVRRQTLCGGKKVA